MRPWLNSELFREDATMTVFYDNFVLIFTKINKQTNKINCNQTVNIII